MKAVLFCKEEAHTHLSGRTERSLQSLGVSEIAKPLPGIAALAGELQRTSEPLLVASAGTWFSRSTPLPSIPASATGRPLLGLGAYRMPTDIAGDDSRSRAWIRLLTRCGGDFSRLPWYARSLPEPAALFLSPEAAHSLGRLLHRGGDLRQAVNRLLRDRRFRSLHLPALDASFDPELRVVQLVTTIQIGGAERVALDLAEELEHQGVAACVATLGTPTRLEFPEPARFVDLSPVPANAESRAEAVAKVCREFGADLVHGHLIRAEEARAIREKGIPVALTLHNMPQAWPSGMVDRSRDAADLLLACSQSVEAAARAHELPIPVRTVWNGISRGRYLPTPLRLAEGRRIRRSLGLADEDLLLVSVANPRRQKRLDRLPEILWLLRQEPKLEGRVHLLLAGAFEGAGEDVRASLLALREAIDRWEVAEAVHWLGVVADSAPVLAAGDVLVSTSDFEGLSLAQLEAAAAGLPIIATSVGGAPELAAQTGLVRLLSRDASSAEFASAIAEIARTSLPRIEGLPRSFHRDRMAARYRWFYPRAIERFSRSRAKVEPEGLWLVTNNFSTGGAQSSARRLLMEMQRRGVKVRAAVVQEHEEVPTPGRTTLGAAGIRVVAIPPPDRLDAEAAVGQLLARIHEDPPQAVVFWNLIASYKVLLADGLLETPAFDVSPGEMYFDAFASYFATPRPGLPYLQPHDYGRRLSGIVVKYQAEAASAAELFGAPVHVIPNGVAPSRAAHRRNGPVLQLGTAARISPQKRLEDLLESVRLAHPRMPPYVLRIAGGPERGQRDYWRKLRQLARGLPVQWCGELADVGGFLGELDLFAMISEPAGCPNASLEAMAAGLPVIATDWGGASEQIVHGETGLLVSPREPRAFADALVELAHQPETRVRFGAAALERVRSHHSLDTMATRYLQLFGLASAHPNEVAEGVAVEARG